MEHRSLLGRLAVLAVAAAACLPAGCKSEMPFDLVPVNGKVAYEDGSLIPAESLRLEFAPAEAPKGPITPPGATTNVNVADGTFAAVTTRRTNDGIVPGRYKVVVVPFKKDAKGNPQPTSATPAEYQKESTTPLVVEVTSSDQFIEIKVPKK